MRRVGFQVVCSIIITLWAALCPTTLSFATVGLPLGGNTESLHETPVLDRTRLVVNAAAAPNGIPDNDDDDDMRDQQEQSQQRPPGPSADDETFMEEASREGADRVRMLTIEERTKRAMLAEAVEDRIFSLRDDLDLLLNDDGMPLKIEYREQIVMLARQIKASRVQYEALVSGRPSELLTSLDPNLSGDQDKQENDN